MSSLPNSCTCQTKAYFYGNASKLRTKLTFPIANSPLSKKKRTPKNRKNTPKPETPIPISVHLKTYQSIRKTGKTTGRDGKQGSYFGNLLSATFYHDFLFEIFPRNQVNRPLQNKLCRRESHVNLLNNACVWNTAGQKPRGTIEAKSVSSMLQSAFIFMKI